MGSDAPDVFDDAALKIGKGEPLNVPTVNRARSGLLLAVPRKTEVTEFDPLQLEKISRKLVSPAARWSVTTARTVYC